MKKLLLFFLLIIIGVFSASARENFSHDINILPSAAQKVVKDNFNARVSHIKIDKSWGRVCKYDVILTDGTEILFDKDGIWKDIEVKANGEVPSAFMPTAMSDYIKSNHKNTAVTGIGKNSSGFEVELSNGVEMLFNSQGRFMRYD